MRAKCVDNKDYGSLLIVGKAYDVLDRGTDVFYLIDEFGDVDKYNKFRFQLLPDEPKAEWMQISGSDYLNIVTGTVLRFDLLREQRQNEPTLHHHKVNIYIKDDSGTWSALDGRADAFAALVGYTWKEG